ncbi:class IV adenylate cyclase [Candidatus Pacearchaeota archaeon]|nr:class IV adenylate cyclase [Candidatus Pacearchaeota archaeon]|tara:strand:+ start:18902 stop:19447 length:546 start_codon:yes stop_codon:yes gene_type:complete
MIEVEAKVEIPKSKLEKLKSKISKISKYSGKEKKSDIYYTLEPLSSYPKKSLRVRSRSGFYEVNFKQRLAKDKNVDAKNEVEFRTKDITAFQSLIDNFGFKPWIRKDKTTHLYKIKKNFNIELNNVEKLGWFLEIEYISKNNKAEISKAKTSVLKVIKSLGYSEKDIVKDGYTKLLWNKRK